jgi:hypothetical protein
MLKRIPKEVMVVVVIIGQKHGLNKWFNTFHGQVSYG